MAKGKLLAEGTNQWLNDGKGIGRENWQIAQLGHGGILITSLAEFTSPEEYSWNVVYEVDRSWSPVTLSIRLEEHGHAVTSTQRAEGERWTARVDNAGQATDYQLPFSPQHEVDFRSPLFNTITLLRARLPVGSSRDLEVVFVEPESLIPVYDKQRYECLAEDKVEVPAGNFPSVKYRMTHPDKENSRTNEFWADRQGIILRYVSDGDEIRLMRYRRNERR